MTDAPRLGSAPQHSRANGKAKAAYAHLAMSEFPYQRMHRTEAPPYVPSVVPNPYDSIQMSSFKAYQPVPKRRQPEFTVGTKNDLGTSTVHAKLTYDQLRLGQIQLVAPDAKGSYSTTHASQFPPPDQADRFQGRAAPRSGIAPRMPYSEVERAFKSLDSTGTMPGSDGERLVTQSEQQEKYPHRGRQPRREPEFTMRFSNDIGSCSKAAKMPPSMLNVAHFDLGKYDGPRYETSSRAAHGRRLTPNTTDPAAGYPVDAPLGPSEVERGFRQAISSRDYNIVSTGQRLNGPLNTEAFRTARATVGLRQQPCVDPAMRGPTGTRQVRTPPSAGPPDSPPTLLRPSRRRRSTS